VRLEDGRLVAAPIGDVNKNRAAYTRALEHKDVTLPFDLATDGLLHRRGSTRSSPPANRRR